MDGGRAFSLNIGPLLATWEGIGMLPLAVICMAMSIWDPLPDSGKRVFSIFHSFTVALLVPAGFLLFRMVSR